jgi:hypothetical protein
MNVLWKVMMSCPMNVASQGKDLCDDFGNHMNKAYWSKHLNVFISFLFMY